MEIPFNKDITYLGKTNFRSTEQLFGIRRKDRRQHMYVLGKSGTGKSVLLQNMIIQNIENGEGLCVVDPHGELVEDVLKSIPPHRMKDVIYFNPADTEYHIGFNVLELQNPKYKHLVASGLMGIFTKIWANAWSSRMEYILSNAILALLDTPGTTLLGIPRLLVDKEYRQTIINNLKDPVVKAFWIHEYEQWRDQFRNEAIAPIQNKVGQFLSSAIIRNVVGQSKSTIDIFEIMNTGKIFLVNVSKGRIGEDNSALLGGMLITKIQLAAMERVRIPENERKDFYLYVDEFQNFVTDSFANILSEARKYRLCLTIAHQYTAQLVTENGTAVRDAVFGNVGTMIVFRIGAQDADFLEKEFEPEITPEDLVSLPNYQTYMKLMIEGVTSRPFSASTLPPIYIEHGADHVENIINESRRLYTLPKKQIERDISRWSGMDTSADEDDDDGELQTEGVEKKPIPGGGGATKMPFTGEKFKANCSVCGKEIMVPFEPVFGRAIYCKEDMVRLKAGEIQPVQNTQTIKTKEIKASSVLGDIGIEFAHEEGRSTTGNFGNARPTERPAEKREYSAPRPSSPPTSAAARPAPLPRVVSTPPRPSAPAPRPVTPTPVSTAPIQKPEVKPVAKIAVVTPSVSKPVPVKISPVVEKKETAKEDELKSFLNNVLNEVIPTPEKEKIEKPKEISLDVLKTASPSPVLKRASSQEHLVGLKAAIAGALQEEKKETEKEIAPKVEVKKIEMPVKVAAPVIEPKKETPMPTPAPSMPKAVVPEIKSKVAEVKPIIPTPVAPPIIPKKGVVPPPTPVIEDIKKTEEPKVAEPTEKEAPKKDVYSKRTPKEVPEDILKKLLEA